MSFELLPPTEKLLKFYESIKIAHCNTHKLFIPTCNYKKITKTMLLQVAIAFVSYPKNKDSVLVQSGVAHAVLKCVSLPLWQDVTCCDGLIYLKLAFNEGLKIKPMCDIANMIDCSITEFISLSVFSPIAEEYRIHAFLTAIIHSKKRTPKISFYEDLVLDCLDRFDSFIYRYKALGKFAVTLVDIFIRIEKVESNNLKLYRFLKKAYELLKYHPEGKISESFSMVCFHLSKYAIKLIDAGEIVEPKDYVQEIYRDCMKSLVNLARKNKDCHVNNLKETAEGISLCLTYMNFFHFPREVAENEIIPAFREVLLIYEKLRKINEQEYFQKVFVTLINFGILLCKIPKMRQEGITTLRKVVDRCDKENFEGKTSYLPYIAQSCKSLAETLIYLCEIEVTDKYINEAHQNIQRTIKILKNIIPMIKDPKEIFKSNKKYAMSLLDLGTILEKKNQLEASIASKRDALKIMLKNFIEERYSSKRNLLKDYSMEDDKTTETINKLLKLDDDKIIHFDDIEIARILYYTGNAFDHDNCLRYLRKSLEIFERKTQEPQNKYFVLLIVSEILHKIPKEEATIMAAKYFKLLREHIWEAPTLECHKIISSFIVLMEERAEYYPLMAMEVISGYDLDKERYCK